MTQGTRGEKQLPNAPSSQSRRGHLQARRIGGLIDMQIGETRNKEGGCAVPAPGKGEDVAAGAKLQPPQAPPPYYYRLDVK